MNMSYGSINYARKRALDEFWDNRIQDEVALAKQIQSQAACTWDEALRAAYCRWKSGASKN